MYQRFKGVKNLNYLICKQNLHINTTHTDKHIINTNNFNTNKQDFHTNKDYNFYGNLYENGILLSTSIGFITGTIWWTNEVYDDNKYKNDSEKIFLSVLTS